MVRSDLCESLRTILFFEEETVRALYYLDMIEKQDGILDTIIYQQDGAPPHSEGTIKPHIQRSLVRP